jgi:uncharacterized membrane protein YadS
VVFLGFGLNLAQIAKVGAISLPIICSTIATALIVAFALHKLMKVPARTSTLIGVGSSICGGSAIAATAPVVGASDEEVAQSISVIFLFNVVAALIFPSIGMALGMSNEGFGLFAGTAINDTSSVTAAAAAWDGMHPGSNALEYATIVKLTRTLAIIPITLVLAVWYARRAKTNAASDTFANTANGEGQGVNFCVSAVPEAKPSGVAETGTKVSGRRGHVTGKANALGNFSLKRAFPMFILYFLLASIVTTVATCAGAPTEVFQPLKTLAKFLIVMAMAAIGLNTNLVKLVKSGGKPIVLGGVCWVCIAGVSILMQRIFGLW